MRYRIPAILVALMAIIGISASTAFGAHADTPSNVSSPFYLVANDNNQQFGITYPGTGDQATITSNPGKSHYIYLPDGTVAIANSNGNCLRMRDANNSYAVMEETGCNYTNDPAERFIKVNDGKNSLDETLWAFVNAETGQFLGVSCPAEDGNKVWGVSGNSGTCFNWVKFAA